MGTRLGANRETGLEFLFSLISYGSPRFPRPRKRAGYFHRILSLKLLVISLTLTTRSMDLIVGSPSKLRCRKTRCHPILLKRLSHRCHSSGFRKSNSCWGTKRLSAIATTLAPYQIIEFYPLRMRIHINITAYRIIPQLSSL